VWEGLGRSGGCLAVLVEGVGWGVLGGWGRGIWWGAGARRIQALCEGFKLGEKTTG